MPKEFEGKIAAVAGGSTGIGRAAALNLARGGAILAIGARGVEELERTATDIRAEGVPCLPVVADFSRRGDAQTFIDAAVKEYGGLDILINVVGGGPRGPILQLTDEDWDKAFETSLFSIVRLCRAAVPHMQRRGGGAIVSTGASSTHHHIIGHTAYTAAKRGLASLTKSLSREFAKDNIRVNIVLSGYSVGERARARHEEAARKEGTTWLQVWERQAKAFGFYPDLGKPGGPEDMANALVFLASDKARYITGISIPVEGGATNFI